MSITSLDKHCAAELKLMRKNYNIKQHTMVEHLGLDTQQQYSDLENGKKHFTDEMILKVCSLFRISILQFVNEKTKTSNLKLVLASEDYQLIENTKNTDLKLAIYKKLFLESKIENIENRLKSLYKGFDNKATIPSKHRIHVMI